MLTEDDPLSSTNLRQQMIFDPTDLVKYETEIDVSCGVKCTIPKFDISTIFEASREALYTPPGGFDTMLYI
jgi:hypothetical protein